MNRIITSLLLFSAISLVAFQSASAITLATVPIGDPGNADDPATQSHYGGVAYNYSIDKYDVTVGQYTAFLNAVAATDTYTLYNTSMATDLNIAGIARSGASGSYSYSVIGSANHPITYVGWGDAARFSNWLHNGQPTGAEGPATTETGAYTLNGAVTDVALNSVVRNAGAKWFIPSESEWYKAAYYDPAAGHYWTYATGTNTMPTSAPPGSTPNSANYYDFIATGYAVTHTKNYDPNQNYLTDVGAYTASPSPYGTFDQTGNMFQWNEALIFPSLRGCRGGSWNIDANDLPSLDRGNLSPTTEIMNLGFRVATTVPEPTAAMLMVIGCGVTWGLRKRFVA